jgi:tRNA pseudouridine13 synthase
VVKGVDVRRLTDDIPGTGGRLRAEVDDFAVEEIPLYAPAGEGEHVLFEIQKRGIPTREAVRRLARALGANPESFGVAGQKDSRAVTRQWLSVAGVETDRVVGAEASGVRVLSAARHGNKLRMGHHRGNRFRVRLREVKDGALENASSALELLARRGVPNRFGPQRFGERRDGHLVGKALLGGEHGTEHKEALALLLGRPGELDPPAVRRSREAYDRGDLNDALKVLPAARRDERACLARLARGEKPARALRAYPKRMRLFFVSALQSHLFNQVLDARMPAIDTVETGDLAWKHDSGAVFRVEDAPAEAPRAESFEISPSGPMFGFRMIEPSGRPGEVEQRVLAEAGLTLQSFKAPAGLKSKGARRPLRVPLGGHSVTEADGGLWISFALPPGSYATIVLDEVMKVGDTSASA